MQGDRAFSFWDVRKAEETPQTRRFSCSAPTQKLIAAGNQVNADADRIQSIRPETTAGQTFQPLI